jgi:hypothetical protein
MAFIKLRARIISPLTLLNTVGAHATRHYLIIIIIAHPIPIAYPSDGPAYRYAAQRIFNVSYRLMPLLLWELWGLLYYRLRLWDWNWGRWHKHGLLLL